MKARKPLTLTPFNTDTSRLQVKIISPSASYLYVCLWRLFSHTEGKKHIEVVHDEDGEHVDTERSTKSEERERPVNLRFAEYL
jgi:hypothetical protein